MPPKGKGKGKGRGKRPPRPAKDKDEYQQDLRGWRDGGGGGSMKDVLYSAREKKLIEQAVKDYCAERSCDPDDLYSVGSKGKLKCVWRRIAKLAELPRRSVLSVRAQVKKLLMPPSVRTGRWTAEEVEILTDAVLTSTSDRPSWKRIGDRINRDADACKHKWKDIHNRRSSGRWSELELWALQEGIIAATGKVAPVEVRNWNQVRSHVPMRTSQQCLLKYYTQIAPKLLAYENKHGVPVETAVFERLILSSVRKGCQDGSYVDIENVNWGMSNPWWPSYENKRHFNDLARVAPSEMLDGDLDDLVDWLCRALGVDGNANSDARTLSHVKKAKHLQAKEDDLRANDEEPTAGEQEGQEQTGQDANDDAAGPREESEEVDPENRRAIVAHLSAGVADGRYEKPSDVDWDQVNPECKGGTKQTMRDFMRLVISVPKVAEAPGFCAIVRWMKRAADKENFNRIVERLLARTLRKQASKGCESADDVDWLAANQWWSASENQRRFDQLAAEAPEAAQSMGFGGVSRWLCDELDVDDHLDSDKAELARKEAEDDDGAEEDGDEDSSSDSDAAGRGGNGGQVRGAAAKRGPASAKGRAQSTRSGRSSGSTAGPLPKDRGPRPAGGGKRARLSDG